MKHLLIVASLITGYISCICNLIGEVSLEWLTKENRISIGLFAFTKPGLFSTYNDVGSVILARGIVTCGFLGSIVGLSVLVVYYVKHIRLDTTERNLPSATAFLFIIGALLALTGAIVFATRCKRDIESVLTPENTPLVLGYSFPLTVVGSIMSIAAGILAVIHRTGLQN